MSTLSAEETFKRQNQVQQVMGLLIVVNPDTGKSYTIPQACNQVGVELRTYQRWREKFSLKMMQDQIANQSAKVTQNILNAYELSLEQVINIATGKDTKAFPSDKLAAHQTLAKLRNEIVAQVASQGEAEDEPEQEEAPAWLLGPATATIHLPESPERNPDRVLVEE